MNLYKEIVCLKRKILTNKDEDQKKYHSLGSVSTLTKMNNDFSKNGFVFIFWNYIYIYIYFHNALKYCDMSSEIIQNVACDNYDDFQSVNFIFS